MQTHLGEVDGIDWSTNVPLEVLERAQIPLGFVAVDGRCAGARPNPVGLCRGRRSLRKLVRGYPFGSIEGI
jgi:hypothetical protein